MSISKKIYSNELLNGINLLFLDTETTALNPGEIAQLSYIISDAELNVIEGKNFYFSVKWVSKGALKVHGLSKNKLDKYSEGKRFGQHLNEINSDLENSYIIAHNANFDIAFLKSEFSKRKKKLTFADSFCTMKFYTPICGLLNKRGHRYKYPKLSEVLNKLEVKPETVYSFAEKLFGKFDNRFHDSRFDASCVYLIYKWAVDSGYMTDEFRERTEG